MREPARSRTPDSNHQPDHTTPTKTTMTTTTSLQGESDDNGEAGVSMEPLLSPPPRLQQLNADEESPASTATREGREIRPAHLTTDSSFWSFFSPRDSKRSGQNSSPLRQEEDERSYPGFLVAWETALCRIRIPLMLFILFVVWPFGALSFRRLQHITDSTFHPVPTSLSGEAQAAFAKSYANDWQDPMHPSLSIVLENPDSKSNDTLIDPTSPLYEQAFNFSIELPLYLNQTCWKLKDETNCTTDSWTKVTSYYSLVEEELTYLAKTLAADSGHLTLVQVQYLLPSNATHVRERVAQLMEAIENFAARYDDALSISFTGLKWFQSDLLKSTQSDLRKMDALVLPLALFLIGIVLKQARAAYVWMLPLCTLLTTVCAWSIAMRIVASKMQITQFTPSIMMSVTLGMGMDYSLFLLSRYLEHMTTRTSSTKQQSIRYMLFHGGHVLLLSGLTLMCTFLGLCFLPLAMLQSVGIGAAVAIGCALFVQLTLVPAVLHTSFGDWIVEESPVQQTYETADDDEYESFLAHRNVTRQRPAVTESSIWKQLSRHLLHPYKSIIIFLVIVQLVLPVAFFATSVKSSLSFDLMLPSSSPSLEAYHRLGRNLGWGRLTPYRILFDGHEAGTKMDSSDGFDVMHRVLDELIAIEKYEDAGITHIATGTDEIQDLTDHLMDTLGLSERAMAQNDDVLCDPAMMERQTMYNGIAVLKNARIPHSLYVAAKYCSHIIPHCPIETMHLMDVVDQQATCRDRYATFITATLGVNPFSDEGIEWLEAARATLQRLEDGGALGDVKVYLEGTPAIEYDAVKAVYGAFPSVITITMAVVFLLMGVFFQSLVAPLRSVISIGLTLSFVFGWLVLVYQHGILNWTRVPRWTSTGDEVSWLVPVMAFSIIVGLALDYDVFLISRILEYRTDERYDHKSSIAAGLDSTGGLITAAGVIMTVAFGGLMFSSSPVLYQWSFLLTTAVLLDTFVIRTLIVPIVTGWTGPRYSWWPRRLPEDTVVYWDGESSNESDDNEDYRLMNDDDSGNE
jgi:uncharacterized membrane protein YdfJ with MMPL/SSD domain